MILHKWRAAFQFFADCIAFAIPAIASFQFRQNFPMVVLLDIVVLLLYLYLLPYRTTNAEASE
jgi:hypothetical protein